jgi:hypothetical protein
VAPRPGETANDAAGRTTDVTCFDALAVVLVLSAIVTVTVYVPAES